MTNAFFTSANLTSLSAKSLTAHIWHTTSHHNMWGAHLEASKDPRTSCIFQFPVEASWLKVCFEMPPKTMPSQKKIIQKTFTLTPSKTHPKMRLFGRPTSSNTQKVRLTDSLTVGFPSTKCRCFTRSFGPLRSYPAGRLLIFADCPT